MKFIPIAGKNSWKTPFCSDAGKGRHDINGERDVCAECDAQGLRDYTSDHMRHEGGVVTLCLICSETYKLVWGLSKVVA